MPDDVITVYGEMCGAKGDPQGQQRFYRFVFPANGHETPWRGPYRDKTDAENAAEDEARGQYVIEWRS